jgi:hypothetical protein
MTLNIWRVNPSDLPQIFVVCTRLKYLTIESCQMNIRQRQSITEQIIRNWNSQQFAHNSSSTYALQELSISWGCGIGLWGFISRSPHLRVLDIHRGGETDSYERKRIDDLVRGLKDGMPSLQHLDLSLCFVKNECLSNLMMTVRCLRSFHSPSELSLSLADFRPHFSTLTTIDVASGTPEFWLEVLSSCRALVKAKEVVLFVEDITHGARWESTGLVSLDLNVFVRSTRNERSSRKAFEDALFRRTAELVKLDHLSVHTGWPVKKTLGLGDQSWEALSKIKTLTSLVLGVEFRQLKDADKIHKRILEWKELHYFRWSVANMPLSKQAEDDAEYGLSQLINALQNQN